MRKYHSCRYLSRSLLQVFTIQKSLIPISKLKNILLKLNSNNKLSRRSKWFFRPRETEGSHKSSIMTGWRDNEQAAVDFTKTCGNGRWTRNSWVDTKYNNRCARDSIRTLQYSRSETRLHKTKVILNSCRDGIKRPCAQSKCHGVPTLRLYCIEMSLTGISTLCPLIS